MPLFRSDTITVTICDKLTIPLEVFNQYEPSNTIKNYDNIMYGSDMYGDQSFTIAKDIQAQLSTVLENEIKQYIDKLNVYKTKEHIRLNPNITIDSISGEVVKILKTIYDNPKTWLLRFESGDFVKNNWDINYTQNQASTILNSGITEPTPLTFWNEQKQLKKIVIHQDRMREILQKTIIIAQTIGTLNYQLYTEIQDAQTQTALLKYTQEYLQGEFDKINRTIVIE